ncbi:MAG: hypothetical protein H6719_30790 [Sandaracinaceae bacterium]|nr:hypothetical protein [Sandaracinaceae bacterium]
MSKTLSIAVLVATLLLPSLALAQAPDRVAFGHPVTVGPTELVHDAVSFGGDTVVQGTVEGDAVAFGGSVVLMEGAEVRGDTVSFGGAVQDQRTSAAPAPPVVAARHAQPDGPFEAVWAFLGETARSAVMHVLLFLLGLLMMGVGRERLGALQVTMIKDGVKTAGTGLLGYLGAVAAIVLLSITLIGIPAAVVVGLALPIATYVGLAAAATVVGAALPLPQLQGKEVHQLAAGVGVLFLASLVPLAGGIFTAAVACLGFGALIRTRFAKSPPEGLPEAGPYRTAAT